MSWIAPSCFISKEAARHRAEGKPAMVTEASTERRRSDALQHRDRPGQAQAFGRDCRAGGREAAGRLRVRQRRGGVRVPAREAARGRSDMRRVGRLPGGHRPLRAQPRRVPRGPRLRGLRGEPAAHVQLAQGHEREEGEERRGGRRGAGHVAPGREPHTKAPVEVRGGRPEVAGEVPHLPLAHCRRLQAPRPRDSRRSVPRVPRLLLRRLRARRWSSSCAS